MNRKTAAELFTIEAPKPIKGSCTKGHEWEYATDFRTRRTAQIANKTWCLLCIEEKLAELGIGEVSTT